MRAEERKAKKRMTAANPTIQTLETNTGYNRSVHAVKVVRKIYARRVRTDEEINNGLDNQTRITESSGTASMMFNACTKNNKAQNSETMEPSSFTEKYVTVSPRIPKDVGY